MNKKMSSQSRIDALIMKQIWEKVISVLYDNNVMYTRANIYRVAQIMMAVTVNMVGMSCNDLNDFKEKAQKMIDNMSSVMDMMPDAKKKELLSAIDNQLNWFQNEYDKQKAEFDGEQETIKTVTDATDEKLN